MGETSQGKRLPERFDAGLCCVKVGRKWFERVGRILNGLQPVLRDPTDRGWRVLGTGFGMSGVVRGPNKIHSTSANADPTKPYVKVKFSTDPFTVTELASQPDTWGEDEMVYEKVQVYGDIVITRAG